MPPAGTFLSEPPAVALVGVIEDPYNLAVAAARTCYSSKGIVTPDDVVKDEKAPGALIEKRASPAKGLVRGISSVNEISILRIQGGGMS